MKDGLRYVPSHLTAVTRVTEISTLPVRHHWCHLTSQENLFFCRVLLRKHWNPELGQAYNISMLRLTRPRRKIVFVNYVLKGTCDKFIIIQSKTIFSKRSISVCTLLKKSEKFSTKLAGDCHGLSAKRSYLLLILNSNVDISVRSLTYVQLREYECKLWPACLKQLGAICESFQVVNSF